MTLSRSEYGFGYRSNSQLDWLELANSVNRENNNKRMHHEDDLKLFSSHSDYQLCAGSNHLHRQSFNHSQKHQQNHSAEMEKVHRSHLHLPIHQGKLCKWWYFGLVLFRLANFVWFNFSVKNNHQKD